jgi:hypothetical protein
MPAGPYAEVVKSEVPQDVIALVEVEGGMVGTYSWASVEVGEASTPKSMAGLIVFFMIACWI